MAELLFIFGLIVFAIWAVSALVVHFGAGRGSSNISPDEAARRMRTSQAPQDPRKIKHKKYGSEYSNWRTVMAREGRNCHICGEPVDPDDWSRGPRGGFIAGNRYPTVDHVTPRSGGGSHHWSNLKLAHMACNSRKGASHDA